MYKKSISGILCGLMIATAMWLVPNRAAAQESADIADVAKCLIAENGAGGDWGAILDVLERRAERGNMSVAQMARAYCAVHRNPHPTPRQLRIRALPSASSLPNLLRRYAEAIKIAKRGGLRRCRADHWGASAGEDFARATRLGWTREYCGDTRNAFWRVPPRVRTANRK